MTIIDLLENARNEFDKAASGRQPVKIRLGRKQKEEFERWATQFTWQREPRHGTTSSWDDIPIEVTGDEDHLEFL